MNLKNNPQLIGVSIFSIVLGFLLAKVIAVPFFKFSEKVDLGNILSMIVTGFIALFVVTFFEKRNSTDRVTKDLIIKKIDQIIEILNLFQSDIDAGQIQLIKANSSIKRVNLTLKNIYEICENIKCNIGDKEKSEIREEIDEIRTLSTDSPRKHPQQTPNSNSEIAIENGEVLFNYDRRSIINLSIDKLKNNLFKLQIEINKK